MSWKVRGGRHDDQGWMSDATRAPVFELHSLLPAFMALETVLLPLLAPA